MRKVTLFGVSNFIFHTFFYESYFFFFFSFENYRLKLHLQKKKSALFMKNHENVLKTYLLQKKVILLQKYGFIYNNL